MADGSPKAALYEGFARVGRALGNPARIELLNLLAQGEHGVEELAAAAGLKVSNTSAQLKTLAAAGLVASRRDGTRVFYRVADPRVTALAELAKQVAYGQQPGTREAARAWLGETAPLEPVSPRRAAPADARGRGGRAGCPPCRRVRRRAYRWRGQTSRSASCPPGWPGCPAKRRSSRTAAAGSA